MKEEDFNWTDEPVIGIVLMTAQHDSNGNAIDPNVFYRVGKHKTSIMLAIIPTERNMKNEFANDILKAQCKFN